jgi:hypothetical protein
MKISIKARIKPIEISAESNYAENIQPQKFEKVMGRTARVMLTY